MFLLRAPGKVQGVAVDMCIAVVQVRIWVCVSHLLLLLSTKMSCLLLLIRMSIVDTAIL